MIGILTPYGRNEVTAAAIRLADLALALGQDVRLVACGVHERNVSPFWDSKVVTGRGTGIYHASRGCDSFVHFICHHTLLEMTSLIVEHAKHTLIVPWQTLTLDATILFKHYQSVVCPSKTCFDVLHQEIYEGDKEHNLHWCRWDSGLPPIKREGRVADDALHVCFFCDYTAIDFVGPLTLQLVQELLDLHPKMIATVVSTKAWSKRDRTLIRHMRETFGKRLVVEKCGDLATQTKIFHHHDWVVLPGIRSDFCMMATRSMSCGTPVICHDVEPFNEHVIEGTNGYLVPCEIRAGACKAPMAVPQLGKWLEVCMTAFHNAQTLLQLQGNNWRLLENHVAFNSYWAEAWGVS